MIERGQTREIPPERKAMGVASISVLFDMSGCGCGQHTGVVFSH